jgi:hypothetical protein
VAGTFFLTMMSRLDVVVVDTTVPGCARDPPLRVPSARRWTRRLCGVRVR